MNKNKSAKEIVFEGSLYSKEAVKLAAYVFTEKCGVRISAGKDSMKLILTAADTRAGDGRSPNCAGSLPPKDYDRQPAADLEKLAGEISNEVLNQQCRIDLAKKNSRIAGIILTKALLSACGTNANTDLRALSPSNEKNRHKDRL